MEAQVRENRRKPRLVNRKLKKYFLGGYAEPLRGDDFRSARLTIPARHFALVKPLRVSLDPIDLVTWTELQSVPDDVCLQTTAYHGSALKLQQELHSAWIKGIGFADDDSLADESLNRVAFEVEAEWQACTFEGLHGFYRQAISTLRAALERTIIALRYQDAPSDPHFKNWLQGQELLPFQPVCDQLVGSNPTVGALNEHLTKNGCMRFVWRKEKNAPPEGWVGRLYADLCHYSHCRPKHASGDLWKGPGPVYDPKAFKLTDRFYRETSALCWFIAKIARPSLALPEAVAAIVASAEPAWKKAARHTYSFLEAAAFSSARKDGLE
jgi:hypothetical protein